jgi:hypothetical protein
MCNHDEDAKREVNVFFKLRGIISRTLRQMTRAERF